MHFMLVTYRVAQFLDSLCLLLITRLYSNRKIHAHVHKLSGKTSSNSSNLCIKLIQILQNI